MMNGPLLYWLAVASVGVLASGSSLATGVRWRRWIHLNRPDLNHTVRQEIWRDVLLLGGLACNLLTGALAAWGPLRSGLGLVCLLGGATLFSAFAVMNYRLRSR